MDSPQSDNERSQHADAEDAMLSKKMKLFIITLSLVLIILLLPLASTHGLPLLKPMGISMLQRLRDAMRFIAVTAAISVGIMSTSYQRNDKSFDRSAHVPSTSSSHRSSTPNASSRRESINPNMIPKFGMNRSGSPNLSVGRGMHDAMIDIAHQESDGTEIGNAQKFRGKELMDDDFPTGTSNSNAFSYASRGEEMYALGSLSKHAHSGRAPSERQGNSENLKQRPTNASHRSSASDAWFCPSTIDEAIEEEYNTANTSHGPSSGKFRGARRVESQTVSSPLDDKRLLISDKEIKSIADRGFRTVYASATDDNYAELRMRKAFLADEAYDASRKGRQRSSSVDRRRPIQYDDQGPDRPGLKQILMDVSKERAFNKTSQIVNEQSDRLQSAQASISSTLPYDNVKPSDGDNRRSNPTMYYKQQEAIKMGSDRILQSKVDDSKMNQTPNQVNLRKKDGFMKDPNQRMQADVRSDQILQKQDYQQAKVGTNQNLLKQADAKMAFAHRALQKANVRMASDSISQMQRFGAAKAASKASIVSEVVQTQHQNADEKGSSATVRGSSQNREDFQPTNFQSASLSSRSKHLMQSSKHSRSALDLEQLEQVGDTLHAKPPAGPSMKRKKSFSCDFGHGFTPDWLWELEPPPPPGFIDQQSVMTSPTEANQSSDLSTSKREFSNEPSSTLVQSLVPWRSSFPMDISARAASPTSPPDGWSSTGPSPSPSEVNRRADEFISNFNTKLIRQRQESLERQRRYD